MNNAMYVIFSRAQFCPLIFKIQLVELNINFENNIFIDVNGNGRKNVTKTQT